MPRIPINIEALSHYRAFLSRQWNIAHKNWGDENPACLSRYMCRYSCIFLQEVLARDHGIMSHFVVGRPHEETNGTAQGRFGFKDPHGNWHDHAWLHVDGMILDVTADQFGGGDIVITPCEDARYNASPDQACFSAELEKLRPRVAQWLEEYYATA